MGGAAGVFVVAPFRPQTKWNTHILLYLRGRNFCGREYCRIFLENESPKLLVLTEFVFADAILL